MNKLVYIIVCLASVGCNLKPVDIWERTKETEMIPLGSYIMMHDDSVKLAKLIDEQESIINERDENGTLLQNAAHQNAIKCARLLVEKGVALETRNFLGQTPLMSACYQNNLEIIELMVEAGANVNAYDRAGGTPLIFAIVHCNGKEDSLCKPVEKTILYLISKGANVNFKGGELANTALGMAKFYGTDPIVKILMRNGAKE